jgi:hypothetical protein
MPKRVSASTLTGQYRPGTIPRLSRTRAGRRSVSRPLCQRRDAPAISSPSTAQSSALWIGTAGSSGATACSVSAQASSNRTARLPSKLTPSNRAPGAAIRIAPSASARGSGAFCRAVGTGSRSSAIGICSRAAANPGWLRRKRSPGHEQATADEMARLERSRWARPADSPSDSSCCRLRISLELRYAAVGRRGLDLSLGFRGASSSSTSGPWWRMWVPLRRSEGCSRFHRCSWRGAPRTD